MASDSANGNVSSSGRQRRLLLALFLLTCVFAAITFPPLIWINGFNASQIAFYEGIISQDQKTSEIAAAMVNQSQHLVDLLQASHTTNLENMTFARKALESSKEHARWNEKNLEWGKNMLRSSIRFSQGYFYFGLLFGIGTLFALFITAQRFFRYVWRQESELGEEATPR